MKLPPLDGDAIARWREVERVTGEGAPLPEELRLWLFQVANRVNFILDEHRLKPEQAAKLMPEAIGLTGRAIGDHREAQRAKNFSWLYDANRHLQPDAKADSVAEHVAEVAKVESRTVYRWIKRRY